MKTLIEYINEAKPIGSFSKKIEFDINISKTFHAGERQSRHGTDERGFISDDEIIETVRKASEKILEDVVNNHIDIDDRFIVRDGNTDLNIVCVLHRGTAPDRLQIDIVTVIRTEKFWNTQNNWVVMVR